jgi:molybdenum cofactor cytidylyltransferase
MAETIAIIVLAAGLSTRFSAGNKLLADLKGRPLADHIASTIAPLPFAAKFAVCPVDLPELGALFARRGFSVLPNPDNAAGLSTSLRLGVAAADKIGADAVLICLADMPFVTSEHLLTLADSLKDGPTHTASAMENGPSMPPAVFARRHFAALLQTSGDRGARDLLRSANQLFVPARELADYDTLEDFASTA